MGAEKSKRIGRALVSVSAIVAATKLAGLVKQIVTASAFGATQRTDIIMLSEGLISNLDYLLVQSMATAFIPTYIAAKNERPEAGKAFVSNTIKAFLLFTACISLLILLGSPLISKILAPSYSAELSGKLAACLRVFAPSLIIVTALAVFSALLKANERFVPSELVGFNQSVILILLVILIGGRFGADTLVIGFYCYAVFNLVFLMAASRGHWRLERGNPFADENVRRLLRMMGPLLLGYSMVFVNQQVDKIIVSGLGEGAVTAMHYAAVLSGFIGTFVGSICGVLFTYVTESIAEQKDEDAAALTGSALVQLVTLLLPVAVLTVLNAGDIAAIVFGRGRFDESAVQNCALALLGYAFMFVPLTARELFSRFQYGYGDSRRPMINSVIGIGFNIAASIVLSRFLGVLGVTLATSISVLICGVLNAFSSWKRDPHLRLKSLAGYLPRWLIGAAVCAAASMIGRSLLAESSRILRFGAITLTAMLGYGAVLFPVLKRLATHILHR